MTIWDQWAGWDGRRALGKNVKIQAREIVK